MAAAAAAAATAAVSGSECFSRISMVADADEAAAVVFIVCDRITSI